jgi:hypothetical protein
MRSSGIRRSCLRSAFLALLVTATFAAAKAQTPRTHVINGVTRDSASGLPIAGALIQIRGDSALRTDRSDDAGNFRLPALAPGRYRLTVLRIGFAESVHQIGLSDRDTSIEIRLGPVARTLADARIRGKVSAVYGVVARLPDLTPLAGATVNIMGATRSATTDSTGRFFIDLGKPGSYLVRITRDGFGEMLFPVEVPAARAVETSRMLEPSTVKTAPGMEHLFAAANERLRSRQPMNSALITASELKASGGGTLRDAIPGSRSMTSKGLRIAPGACIFLNGRTTSMPLEAIDVNEVEAVEVYGRRGEMTATLVNQPCNNRPNPGSRTVMTPGRAEDVRYIVIWLKK